MKRLIVVSHTHWDREWYLTFQQFRLKLVRMVDKLLDVLERHPRFRYFMLDGQTVVLEDYLEVRPENAARLRRYVRQGRILVGPWYILPDEFLVSGEAMVRNLMLGHRMAGDFGAVMKVGYLPDSFGQTGQIPQIMRGFGIDCAVIYRGVGPEVEQSEFLWQAPDGSEVLAIHLPHGYCHAQNLPTRLDAFMARLAKLRGDLEPFATTDTLLIMNGCDHLEPQPELPAMLAAANRRLSDAEMVHGTLPMYVQEVREQVGARSTSPLQTLRGEFRSSLRSNILPAVSSTRMWIKQRNYAAETLLEKWAEPASAFAALEFQVPSSKFHVAEPGTWNVEPGTWNALLWQSWRYLLQNQPHDSICGCSIDQVHREMVTRFDWSQQIAAEVTRQSLQTIAGKINTASMRANGSSGVPIVVFNPVAGPRTDTVSVSVELPGSLENFVVEDAHGQVVPHQVLGQRTEEFASLELAAEELAGVLGMVEDGRVLGMTVQEIDTQVSGRRARLGITLSDYAQPDPAVVAQAISQAKALIAEKGVRHFQLRAHKAMRADVLLLAQEVPGHGYKTYALRARRAGEKPARLPRRATSIENEFFRVQADRATGTLTVTDRASGAVWRGLNRFVDGADAGDLYNYSPPENDGLVEAPATPPRVTVEVGPARSTLRVELLYRLPARLADDRQGRSSELVDCPIVTEISLVPGVRRVDVRTTVDNGAADHRLRVHFPTPVRTAVSHAEGLFDVVSRPVAVPPATEDGGETPMGTYPQKTFVDVNDGQVGLLVANRGLPEFEVLDGAGGVTVALTLLRCVGWLSRDDFRTRRGHAGPMIATPEAQCPGRHVFEYALVPHTGTWAGVFPQAHAFAAPLRAEPAAVQAGPLPLAQSFVEVSPDSLVVSAIKQPEGGAGLIVRCWNTAETPVEGRVRLCWPFARATRVNLNEEEMGEVAQDGADAVRLAVRGREIVSLRFEGMGEAGKQ
jgi:alpha-mannosidase